MKRLVLLLVLGAGALSCAGCARGQAAAVDDGTAVVRRDKFVVWVNARGKVTAESNVTVAPPRWWAGLKISKLVAKEGDKVDKDAVLITLEADKLDDSITDVLRDIRSSEGALDSAKASLRSETDRLNSEVNKAREDLAKAVKALEEMKKVPLPADLRNAEIDRETKAKAAEQAKERYENMKVLYGKGGGISLQELEQRDLEYHSAETDAKKAKLTYEVVKAGPLPPVLRDAQVTVELADLALKVAERTRDLTIGQLEETVKKAEGYLNWNKVNRTRLERVQDAVTIRAPVAGTVFYCDLWTDEGQEKLKEGMEVHPWDRLLELPDTSRMQIAVEVEEQDIGKVETGQHVLITLDAYRQKSYTGKVTKIEEITHRKGGREAGRVDSTREDVGTKVVEVIVTFDDQDPVIRTGLNGRAEIRTQQQAEGLLVPLKALFTVGGKDVVYLLKGGEPVETPVKVGGRSDADALILVGVHEGDRVSLTAPGAKPEEKEEGK